MSSEIDYKKHKAHPTSYNGIIFRSRLEATWAAFFDQIGWQWKYEAEDFSKWTPDFIITGRDHLIRIEVKPIELIKSYFYIANEVLSTKGFEGDFLVLGNSPFMLRDSLTMGIYYSNVYGFNILSKMNFTKSADCNYKNIIGISLEYNDFDFITSGRDIINKKDIDSILKKQVNSFWAEASNKTRYLPPQVFNNPPPLVNPVFKNSWVNPNKSISVNKINNINNDAVINNLPDFSDEFMSGSISKKEPVEDLKKEQIITIISKPYYISCEAKNDKLIDPSHKDIINDYICFKKQDTIISSYDFLEELEDKIPDAQLREYLKVNGYIEKNYFLKRIKDNFAVIDYNLLVFTSKIRRKIKDFVRDYFANNSHKETLNENHFMKLIKKDNILNEYPTTLSLKCILNDKENFLYYKGTFYKDKTIYDRYTLFSRNKDKTEETRLILDELLKL